MKEATSRRAPLQPRLCAQASLTLLEPIYHCSGLTLLSPQLGATGMICDEGHNSHGGLPIQVECAVT